MGKDKFIYETSKKVRCGFFGWCLQIKNCERELQLKNEVLAKYKQELVQKEQTYQNRLSDMDLNYDKNIADANRQFKIKFTE